MSIIQREEGVAHRLEVGFDRTPGAALGPAAIGRGRLGLDAAVAGPAVPDDLDVRGAGEGLCEVAVEVRPVTAHDEELTTHRRSIYRTSPLEVVWDFRRRPQRPPF